jgi:hypothetical protein
MVTRRKEGVGARREGEREGGWEVIGSQVEAPEEG